MKIRKNGKTYNTETAKVVAHYENDYYYSDSRWQEETLYQKKDGTMFMICDGNAMSKYTHSIDMNSWRGATYLLIIEPGDEQEAIDYVNRNFEPTGFDFFDKYIMKDFDRYGYWGNKNLSYTWINTNCFEI